MKHRNAFTLLEVLVSITILSVVVVTVYASVRLGLSTYRRIDAVHETNQNARQALNMISRDVQCAFLSDNPEVVFIGDHDPASGSDRLTLVTYLTKFKSTQGALTKISYFIDTDPKTPQEGLVMENAGFPMKAKDNIVTTPVVRQEIAPLVRKLEFLYSDGAGWHDVWGTESASFHRKGVLPAAVQIKITLVKTKDADADETFSTMIPVHAHGSAARN